MKRFIKPIFLATLFFCGAESLWALRVVPTYQVFRLKPGQKSVGQLTITNAEDMDVQVVPSVMDFYTLPANKKVKVSDWLKINSEEFHLKKGESKSVSFSISVPKHAKGELAGRLHFSTRSEQKSSISLALSLAVYVAVEGTEKAEIKIPGFAVDVSSDTTFSILVNNTGNMHVRPRGYIQVFNQNEEIVVNAEIVTGHPALPGQPRMYQSNVKDFRLPEGRYRAEIRLDDVDYGVELPIQKYKFRINKVGKTEAD